MEQTLYLQPLSATSPVTENLPEVDVVVNLGKGVVFLSDDISNSNIMSLRVKGVYSLPEGWSPSPLVSFTIATPKPNPGDNSLVPLSMANGEIKPAGEVDLAQSMRLWKWAELSPATAGLSSLTDHVIESNAIEDESGQISSYDDIDFRRLAESRRPRIVWNSELRTYLTPTLNTALLRQLSRSPIWPVELVRISSSSSGRGKSKEEETTISHHGVAYLDLSSLLYPGVTRVFGAYYVESLNEIELGERTNEVHTKNVMESLYKSGAFGSGKKFAAKRPSTSMRASVVSINSAAETLTSESKVDGHVYKDARTYMLLELELSNPLVPKRPASVIAEK
ncbi:PREDICTED: cilia- and flagella-associated protein 70-like [Amphimedon queenslandica]|uniref:Uncharacterized protein n=1 Tax=Amphimedon queenslandica TaxID=400682 RepID=A0A1X7STF7_AMPQE|nr:PREDICTED: cilia- and flagella-associated protein 70-like [Amphimedon queenslandica]|eukprot:XP_019862810.1 PREDICTED: cilia- and flagella-associated protein 70-like [Amphimedon queenslandica]